MDFTVYQSRPLGLPWWSIGWISPCIKVDLWDFPGGPLVKDPPANAGHVGSIPGPGTRILHTVGQLSP